MWDCFHEKHEKSGILSSAPGSVWFFLGGGSGTSDALPEVDPWAKLTCLPLMARRRPEMLGEMVFIL